MKILMRSLKYLAITVLFALVSSGVAIAAVLNDYEVVGNARLLWLILPMTALFLAAVVADVRLAVPRFLLSGRYGAYCGYAFSLAYIVPLVAYVVEMACRSAIGLPQRVTDLSSPWILVDCLSNSVLLFMILLSFGAYGLYRRWTAQLRLERATACRLEEYIGAVRQRLDPDAIFTSLAGISAGLRADASEVGAKIRALSDTLRRQLYELPMPPAESSEAKMTVSNVAETKLADVISGRRYRWVRFLVFQLGLIIMSLNVFFDTPDQADFSLQRLPAFFGMYLIFLVLAGVDILWLFRRFKRRRSVKRYLREVAALIAAIAVMLVVVELVTYSANPYDQGLPFALGFVATLGSVATISFFVGGVTAFLLLQDWIAGRRRAALLRAELVKQEYAYLRKQINPHFLFNVLNNVTILAGDDPAEAARMLSELVKLLRVQLVETSRPSTTLADEVDFLRSYLSLQSTRVDRLSYSLTVGSGLERAEVPTLIFITFVENAVKHSTVVDSVRDIAVEFSLDAPSTLRFSCVNTFNPGSPSADRHSGKAGGLGLSNTLRRLELLYGPDFSLSRQVAGLVYEITLKIPLR